MRRGEASEAHAREIKDGLWTVPAERLKGKLEFVVPLSEGARELLGAKGAPELDAFEIDAALEAGAEAGAFLEECGTTDLAQLTSQQWRELLRRLLTGFEQALRRKILTGESLF